VRRSLETQIEKWFTALILPSTVCLSFPFVQKVFLDSSGTCWSISGGIGIGIVLILSWSHWDQWYIIITYYISNTVFARGFAESRNLCYYHFTNNSSFQNLVIIEIVRSQQPSVSYSCPLERLVIRWLAQEHFKQSLLSTKYHWTIRCSSSCHGDYGSSWRPWMVWIITNRIFSTANN
jgi:hypothetical protein